MDINLQPRAARCHLTQRDFLEGDRVLSILVDDAANNQVLRFDLLESESANFHTDLPLVCRWVRPFKPRAETDKDAARNLKLSAEELFLTLADPANEPSPENDRLIQFLSILLERKKILRAKSAPTPQQATFEHARTKQLFTIRTAPLTPDFFHSITPQLTSLLNLPQQPTTTATPPPSEDPPAPPPNAPACNAGCQTGTPPPPASPTSEI